MVDYNIREYRNGDEPKILELLDNVFNGWGSMDHWRWKYEKNPSGKPSIVVAEKNDLIVGHFAVIPIKFSVDGRVKTIGYACDAATHVDYRGQGIFTSLVKFIIEKSGERGYNFIYGYPDPKAYRGFVCGGFEHSCIVQYKTRIIDWSSIFYTIEGGIINPYHVVRGIFSIFFKKSLDRRMIVNLICIRDILVYSIGLLSNPIKAYKKIKSIDDMVEIERSEDFSEVFDEFWGNYKKEVVSIEQTSDYLSWRFIESGGGYETFIIKDSMEGFVVLKTEGDRGIIVDIKALNEDSYRILIEFSMGYLLSKDIARVIIWSNRDGMKDRILRDYGFMSPNWLFKILARFSVFRHLIRSLVYYSHFDQDNFEKNEIFKRWVIQFSDNM